MGVPEKQFGTVDILRTDWAECKNRQKPDSDWTCLAEGQKIIIIVPKSLIL